MPLKRCRRFGSDDTDGEFVEEIEGDENKQEGERVAGRGDDGGQYKQDHDGVAAVFLKESAVQDSEPGQEPGEQGHFEDDAHYKDHAEEIPHIGIQGNLIGNGLAYLILGQEAEGKRKNQAVAGGTAEEEHECPEEKRLADGFLFVWEEGGPDEFPQFIDDVWKKQEEREPERCRDVRHELGRDVDVDDVGGKAVVGKVGKERNGLSRGGEPFIHKKIRGGGPQDDRIENIRHRQKTPYDQNDQNRSDPDQCPPQHFEMIPERHPGLVLGIRPVYYPVLLTHLSRCSGLFPLRSSRP